MSDANSATLISGPTGSGKTSLIATAAEWAYRNHKKITRLYVCDGGGFGTKMQSLVKAGIVQVWKVRTRASGASEGLVEETCMRISQGWWPSVITDPMTGDSPEAVEMLPPMTTTYKMSCPAGHLVKEVTTKQGLGQAMTCPVCKTIVTLQNGVMASSSAMTKGFENVGVVLMEGLTSMSDWIMLSLADRTGKSELGGEKPALGGNIRSGGMTFGSNNRAHYGFAQTQAEKWLLASTTIPGLVLPPIWTALESRVDESGGIALPFYGPSIAGQAKTGKVPQWVGNYLGCQVVTTDKGKKEWRLYLTEYRGEDSVPHLYKSRAEPGVLPEFLADKDKPFEFFNLGVMFDLLEGAKVKSYDRVMQEFPDAPGLPAPGVEVIKPPVAPVPVVSTPAMPPKVGTMPGIPTLGKPLPKPSTPAAPPKV